MLKTEGLPYTYLHLPSIAKVKKLPVILSREEIWRMLQSADLLKHKLLIGLIYGCGLRCMEVRNIKLSHLDFDRKMLHIVQSKGNKDRYVPLSDHLIRDFRLLFQWKIPFIIYSTEIGIPQVLNLKISILVIAKEAYNGPSNRFVKKQALAKSFILILCGTATRLIYWKTAFQSLWFRNFWDMKE